MHFYIGNIIPIRFTTYIQFTYMTPITCTCKNIYVYYIGMYKVPIIYTYKLNI